jgi:hypothetical protein
MSAAWNCSCPAITGNAASRANQQQGDHRKSLSQNESSTAASKLTLNFYKKMNCAAINGLLLGE